MGRVKPRLGAETTKEGSISLAIKAYQSGAYLSIRQAAESQGLPYSTLYGRLKGRQSRKKAHEIDQILGDIEEKQIVKQIEDMDNRGFPLRVDSVKEMALKLVLNREGQTRDTATMALGKNWITRFLDRHPHLASKFSTQVKKQRIMNSNPKILKQSFDKLGPIIRQYNIQPYNIYNMDEKGL